MKDRVLIASSVILVFIALMIGKYSHNSMGFEEAYWQILPITICGLSISFMVFALSKENSKSAFYESLNRRRKDKSLFSYKRANRIYWIKWVLENPNAELYKGYDHSKKGYDESRRIAICVDNYAVVIELNKNKDKAKFITAYVADGTNGKGEKAIDLIRSSEKW